jgi:post-segregation antitoxin (ccd killing protein)
MLMRMPKMQVYLPDELYRRVKAEDDLNVSKVLQDALGELFAQRERAKALDELIAAYEAEHGVITDEEMEAQEAADRANAYVSTGKPKRRRSAA